MNTSRIDDMFRWVDDIRPILGFYFYSYLLFLLVLIMPNILYTHITITKIES